MSDESIGIYVTALNDDGDEERQYAWGPTVDEAVALAIEEIRERTGDDTFVMNDWEAA